MSDGQTNHKADVLGNLRAEHDALAKTVSALSPAQLTAHGVHGDGNEDWTVKDILSHITWWEQSVFGWLGVPPVVEREPLPAGELSEDEANHIIFERNKGRELAEVLETFERSYTALLQALEGASEEQLNQPRNADPGGSPLWEIIPGNTYEHYRAHHDAIRAWLSTGSGGTHE